MIHVIAVITTKPGKREEVLKLFRANIPNVLAEDGCIEYVPVVDVPGFGGAQAPLGEDSFIVVEKWASPEALKAHAAAPHMKAYGEASGPLVANRAIHVLNPAA
ncbi:antibiotic biosynthesis monooxygenase [Acetobacteraceae bacterium AT-5844]|nr:antibiotic biosynthesis monooxygenase [Acetobacteraceae bacterium AT-5844]